MRERLIDSALLVALVVIALVIVWTLFGSSFNSPNNFRAAQRSAETTVDVPLTPAPVTDTSSEGTTSNVEAVPLDTPTVAETTTPESDLETSIATPETAALPAIAGATEVGRIGFGRVTGLAHACNIVLEPWQHIAVSSDLEALYPCGATVTVQLDQPVNGRSSFTAVVADRVPSATDTIVVYVGQDEPASEYGLETGRVAQ